MTETPHPPLPGPGWYADPERPHQLRYWDGAAWGRPWEEPGSAPVPLGPGFVRLGRGVRTGLKLVAVALLAQVALYAWGIQMFGGAVASGDIDTLTTFDNLDRILSITFLVLVAPTGIAWMVWQYRLARSADRTHLTRAPGWHAFAWITPVVVLWFPYQNVRDLWVSKFGYRPHDVIGWWWAFWTAFIVLDRVVASVYGIAETVSDLQLTVLLGLVADVIGLVALFLGLRINRELSEVRSEVVLTPAATPAG